MLISEITGSDLAYPVLYRNVMLTFIKERYVAPW